VDDAALIERMLAGDERAFVEIVRRYDDVLVRLARTHVGSEATARDVAQETWVAVLRGLDRFEGRSSFKTWLLRICANRAKSVGAREHRSVPVDPTETGPTVASSRFDESGMWRDPPVPFTELVEGRIASADVVSEIRRTIDGLHDPARTVVTLRDVEGLSTGEVAELLGLTEANVRVILHRGRARVRAALEAMTEGGRRWDS
jgi:RNA polymerase sigma-70 factor (ECF subfamily)